MQDDLFGCHKAKQPPIESGVKETLGGATSSANQNLNVAILFDRSGSTSERVGAAARGVTTLDGAETLVREEKFEKVGESNFHFAADGARDKDRFPASFRDREARCQAEIGVYGDVIGEKEGRVSVDLADRHRKAQERPVAMERKRQHHFSIDFDLFSAASWVTESM